MTARRSGTTETDGPAAPRSPWRFLPLAVLILATAAVFATGAHRYLGLGSLIAHRDRLQAFVDANAVEAVALYMLVYVACVALSIPSSVFLTILGGFLFGWLVGVAAAVVSATIGAVVVFSIARTSIGDILLRKAGPRLQGLARGFRQDAFSYLLFLRFLPVFPFWLTNLSAAVFGVRLRTFALATVIGIVPGTCAFAVAGVGLDSVIAAQRAAYEACLAAGGGGCGFDIDLAALITPQLVLALAALGAASLVPVLLKRRLRSRLVPLDEDGGSP